MYEECISKACKSFRRRVNTIIVEMAATLSKSTVLCLTFYFVINFFLLNKSCF